MVALIRKKFRIVKSKVPPALYWAKGPASSTAAWTPIRSMQTHASSSGKATGKSMVPLSAGQPLRTGSSLQCWALFPPSLYDYFHRQLAAEGIWQMRPRVQVLKEPGRSAKPVSSCGCTAPGKMVFRSSCCMDIPRRGAEHCSTF